ncbi:RNA-directed DNA polymerase like [Apostasia shenzhenica]|uniref:RNA-directed DNA polymerase like n=1 Tax=Apostasia shenzhenica TaxID=1088818 RepID=A0A2I0BBH0_9ASPA|nr:RNA-directed DNA polymerase like [Apostasia shenzhenica]
MVDRTVGYEVMSFLDAFSGYHQIWMAKGDEEKTAFITDYGTYCYRVMPFGLKNAGATYQRMIDAVFKNQRGRNLEAYVDDILVKSKILTEHLGDLRETLDTLRRYDLKLNPASPMGAVLHQAVTLRFKATNNQAEYEALIAGLNFALSMAVKRIQVFSDSLLVVNQVNQTFETKDEVLKKYLQLAKSLISLFEDFSLTHIPREENQVADQLAKEGLPDLHQTQVFERPSFECTEVSSEEQPPCWMDMILDYLKGGTQPDDRREAQKLKLICAKYTLVNGELYRRSYAKPLTKWLRFEEALKVMEVVHQGECGTHARGRSLVMRILRQGFFWPNIHKDAQVFVEKCPQCQYYADMQRQPAGCLKPINSSWPFAILGLDFLGPMPTAMKGYKWILVAVDYFTKWIEAKPLTQPTAQNVENFLWANILCRYGIPMVIITDNGTPFANQRIHDFSGEHQINLKYDSVWHPHTNGQAEAANKDILNILKKRLDGAKARWPEELPGALWAYNIAPSEVTQESPFSLSYGMDVVILVELEHLSPRVKAAASFEPEALQTWADETMIHEELTWIFWNKKESWQH